MWMKLLLWWGWKKQDTLLWSFQNKSTGKKLSNPEKLPPMCLLSTVSPQLLSGQRKDRNNAGQFLRPTVQLHHWRKAGCCEKQQMGSVDFFCELQNLLWNSMLNPHGYQSSFSHCTAQWCLTGGDNWSGLYGTSWELCLTSLQSC